jgi:hypothetical protein
LASADSVSPFFTSYHSNSAGGAGATFAAASFGASPVSVTVLPGTEASRVLTPRPKHPICAIA